MSKLGTLWSLIEEAKGSKLTSLQSYPTVDGKKKKKIHLLQSGLKLVILWEDTHKHTQTSCSHVVLGNKLTDSEFGQL